MEFPPAGFLVLLDAINILGVGVEAVEAQLVLNPEEDEQGAGHAQGQAGDVDEGISFVFPKVAKGDLEVAFKHLMTPIKLIADMAGKSGQDLAPAIELGEPRTSILLQLRPAFFKVAGRSEILLPLDDPLQ